MFEFASGDKKSYYGKADVVVYRLHRPDRVFGAKVTMLIYGDAFWRTYTTGDNTGLVATDSMKNFIQRETAQYDGAELEAYCQFLAQKFLAKYPQSEGVQVRAEEIPYGEGAVLIPRRGNSFRRNGAERTGRIPPPSPRRKFLQRVRAR
jgi:urate oxidase / 2-oxo-4-hydroxy-4-carboxy-5-ureidoimidazoline decarboxylase